MKRKPRRVRVALIKAFPKWGTNGANLKLFERLANSIKDQKVDVLVSPECFLDGYMVRKKKLCTPKKLAERCVSGADDPSIELVRELSRDLKCHIVFGASEMDAEGTVRNAAYLFGRNGGHLGTFYKVQPNKFYVPGNDLPVFETDFGIVGILICADRRWPENARCLRLKGAEILLNPTWGFMGDLNNCIMQTRAYENGIPICFAHPGQSLVCLQDGSIGAILESNHHGVLIHDVDLSKNVKVLENSEKASSHPVQNRRPELYGDIVTKT
jgi:predicted amidohydrolase